jgi:hypothetical protein
MLPSEKATELVKDRQETYGHPSDVYSLWSQLIYAATGTQFSVEECAVILILLKLAREMTGHYPSNYTDNVDDIAGYANVLAMVKERRAIMEMRYRGPE